MTSTGSTARPSGWFATTHWSVVLAAGRHDDSLAAEALAKLCQTYWYPLYAYVRHRGHSPQDAQDLTQEFFARLLSKNTLGELSQEGGKFRSFLLTTLNHFLVDEWRKERAQKRGGGRVISLDGQDAETRFGNEPVERMTPERLFEQNWALALLEAVYRRLHAKYEAAGKAELFTTLKFCLTGERSAVPYVDLAKRLGVEENTVKTLVHRLRRDYRAVLRDEVANSLVDPGQVEDELRSLFRALADS